MFLECRKLKVPLWIAIFHDYDKFFPDVWFPYVRLHANTDDSRRSELYAAFQQAKLIHQHWNKHHWQFWLYVDDCGAGRSMGKPDLLGWYTECHKTMQFHPETRTWLETQPGYPGE